MNGGQPDYAMPVEAATRTLTPTLVLNALKRWWLPATATSLILVACSAAVTWFTFQPTYRAAAWLQIRENPTHLAYPTHDNAARFVQNQIELLHSSLVIGPALANPEVAKIAELQQQSDPINWLSRRVRVVGIGNSELFEISYDSAHPEASATLVNAVVESYLALRNEHDTTHSDRMLELLEEEKQLRAQEVSRMREHVRELSKQLHGRDPYTGNPSGDIVLLKHPLDDLMNRLTTSQVDRKMQEVQLSALTEMSQGATREVPVAIIDGAVEQRPEIIEIKALLSNKQAMRDRVAETSAKGEQDSAYHRVARDVTRLEQLLQRTRGSLRETVKEEVAAEAKIRQGDELAAMQQALATTTVTEKALREQYQERLKAASQTGDQSLDLEFARAELTREEKVFELIAERAVALRTETRAPARVTLMKSAVVPKQPVETMPLKMLLMAIAVSMSAPFGLALAWEYYVRRINDAHQLNQDARLSVIGEVAHLPKHGGNLYAHSDTLHDLSLFEESVDSLRTCLVLDDHHRDVRIIAVTSAVSGEGKTSVAAQLAVSIA
ncbi:MAG TPA: hypothetical protein VL096_05630, partial [Pirellulaceae bacterium]|nr:hypothetical protein [Pirellulaceae bacterium]